MAELDPTIQPQSDFVKKAAFILDEWRALTVIAEKTVVPNLAATVPWIAPLVPAWFAFENTTSKIKLGLPPLVGVIISASIEGLGIAVVTTTLELWDWNDRNNDKKITAPLYVSAGMVILYMSVVLVVNVGIDLDWADWIVKTILSTLTIPAVVTLALRNQHSRRIAAQELAEIKAKQVELVEQETKRRQDEIELELQHKRLEFDLEQKRLDAENRRQIKIEKVRFDNQKAQESFQKVSDRDESFQKVSESSDQWRTLKKKLSDAQLYAILRQPKEELARQYGKTEKAVEKWAIYAAEEIQARGLAKSQKEE